MGTIVSTRTSTPNLVLLLTLSMFLSYADRTLLAIAGPQLKGELGLTATSFGLAVSAFYWVYAPGNIVSGWLVDRFSVYRLYSVGMVLSAVGSLLLGAARSLILLVILRVLLGFGQSFAFTGTSKKIAGHCGGSGRGSANGCVASGVGGGQALCSFIGGLIMAAYGWRTMSVLFGIVTLAWLLPWGALRLDRLEQKGPVSPTVPFREIMKRKPLWISCAAHFCSNYGFYFLISWLPLYLTTQRHLSIELMATLTGVTFVVQASAALTSGWVSDQCIAWGMAESSVRKGFAACFHVILATSIFGIALSQSQEALIFWLMLAGVGLGCTPHNFAIPQLFAGPLAAGRWVGLQNASGNVAGIVGPVLTGIAIDATGNYWAAFILAATITLAAAALWSVALPHIQLVEWQRAGETVASGTKAVTL